MKSKDQIRLEGIYESIQESQQNPHARKELDFQFKCTDADEDGIFHDTPWGEIDTTEFSNFIEEMEEHEISSEEFAKNFMLPSFINYDEHTQFYVNGKWVVIFDGDVHFVFEA